MKAISLWQPWASMIALDGKHYETRSWSTPYRGPLVIHAAKRFANDERLLSIQKPFSVYFVNGGYKQLCDVPLGAALCIVDLVAVHRTEAIRDSLSAEERGFGDYSNGRYAWELANLRVFPEPIPMKGMQGLFDAEIAVAI